MKWFKKLFRKRTSGIHAQIQHSNKEAYSDMTQEDLEQMLMDLSMKKIDKWIKDGGRESLEYTDVNIEGTINKVSMTQGIPKYSLTDTKANKRAWFNENQLKKVPLWKRTIRRIILRK